MSFDGGSGRVVGRSGRYVTVVMFNTLRVPAQHHLIFFSLFFSHERPPVAATAVVVRDWTDLQHAMMVGCRAVADLIVGFFCQLLQF